MNAIIRCNLCIFILDEDSISTLNIFIDLSFCLENIGCYHFIHKNWGMVDIVGLVFDHLHRIKSAILLLVILVAGVRE